jgi:heme/copper-type cytochrome/quinol oxidase subunit 1
MHGTTMIFLVVMPLSAGFANYLVPLMIGARDVAFPRLNAFGYWVFLVGGLFMYSSFLFGGAPNGGWFGYSPQTALQYSPGHNIDYWVFGLQILGIASLSGAVNLIVTIVNMRAPGMSFMRMPIFVWMSLVAQMLLLFAMPVITVALFLLMFDRLFGANFFNVNAGADPLLWQHLFWIFGHPEVYIIVLPAFGIATAIIPTFVRRRMVAFALVALAELMVGFIGFGVWAHHMFAVGLPALTTIFFAAASLVIVIPSGIQIFAWITTIVTGRPRFVTPLLWIVGFIVFFIFGGLSGITFAAIPFDQPTSTTSSGGRPSSLSSAGCSTGSRR